MSTEPKNGLFRQVLTGTIIAIFGAGLGFGGTTIALIPQLTRNTQDIISVRENANYTRIISQENTVAIRLELENERKRNDARVFEVVGLMKELLATNRELMTQNRETMAALRERKTP